MNQMDRAYVITTLECLESEIVPIDDDTRQKQNDRILKYLMERGSITQDEADGLKVKRLSARIFDLRNQGHEIVTDTIRGKNEYGRTSYARYRMVG